MQLWFKWLVILGFSALVVAVAPTDRVTVSSELRRMQIQSTSLFGEMGFIEIQWEPFAGAKEYQVQVALDSFFNTVIIDRKTTTTLTKFSYKAHDTKLFWRVRNASVEEANWSKLNTIQLKFKRPLSAPGGVLPKWKKKIRVTDPSKFALEFVWTQVAYVDRYVLQLSTDKEFTDVIEYVSDTNQYVLTEPPPAGDVYWRVMALGTPKAGEKFQEPVINTSIKADVEPNNLWRRGTRVPYMLQSDWSPTYRMIVQEDFKVPQIEYPKEGESILYEPDESPSIEFRFGMIPNEENYFLQVARDDGFKSIIHKQFVQKGRYSWKNISTKEDQLYWRIKVDSEAAEPGYWQWSKPAGFTMHANLPRPKLVYPVENENIKSFKKKPSLEMQFTRIENARIYEIQLSTEASFLQGLFEVGTAESDGQSVTVSYRTQKELPSGQIFWRVRSKVGNIHSPWSDTGVFLFNGVKSVEYPIAKLPKYQDEIMVEIDAPVLIDFTWLNKLKGKSQIQASQTEDFKVNLLDQVTEEESLSKVELKLDDGPVFWRLRSQVGEIESEWSPVQQFEVVRKFEAFKLIEPKDKVSIDRWVHQKDNQVFSWEKSIFATGYEIQIAKDSQFREMFNESFVEKNSYRYEGYFPDGKVFWRVRATWKQARSSWTRVRSLINNQRITRPTALEPKNTIVNLYGSADANIKYKWDIIPEAEDYELQVSDKPDFSRVIVDLHKLKEPEIIVNKKYAEGTHYWRIRSQARGVRSKWSVPVSFRAKRVFTLTTPKQTAPFEGASFVVSSKKQSELGALSWEHVKTAKLYRVEIARDPKFFDVVYSNEEETETHVPTELLPLGEVYWRVRSEYHDAKSPWSPGRKIILKIPIVINMKSAQRYHYTGDKDLAEVNLSWGDYRGDTSYRVEVATDKSFDNIVKSINTRGIATKFYLPPKGKFYWRVFASTDILKSEEASNTSLYSVTSDVEWFSVKRQENLRLALAYGYETVTLEQDVSAQSTNVRDGTAEGTGFGTFHADFEYWFMGAQKEWGVITEMNFSKPTVNFSPTSVFNSGDVSDYSTLRIGILGAKRLTYGRDIKVIMAAGLKRANRHLIRRENNIFFADAFKEFYFAQELAIEFYPQYGKYYAKAGLQFIERVDNLDTWSFIPTIQARYRVEYMSFGAKFQVFDQTLNFTFSDNATGQSATAEVTTTSYVLLLQMGFHY